MTDLDAYLTAMEAAGIPLLGHFVIYSVRGGDVTPGDLEKWFTELGLDEKHLPPPQGAVHAFERATGREAKCTYPIDEKPSGRRRRGTPGAMGREATLMVRHVARGRDMIVRHVVREVRDAGATRLSYDTHLADARFHYTPDAGMWAGELRTVPDAAAIAALPEAEQAEVAAMLAGIETEYARHCTYVGTDKLRGTAREYVKSLNPICIRAGVYFVHARHAETLGALRELVGRFGPGSSMSLTPLPDLAEIRETVVSAFMEETAGELDKLSRDIRRAQEGRATPSVLAALNRRREELKASAAEHSSLLETSLGDLGARVDTVDLQFATLAMAAGDDEGGDTGAGEAGRDEDGEGLS